MNLIIKIVLIIICVLILILLIGLGIFGILYKPSPKTININPTVGNMNIDCSRNQTTCRTQDDCKNMCLPGIDYDCRFLGSNSKKKVCAPHITSSSNCNQNFGGNLIWTGWAGIDKMGWECNCSEPEWSNTQNCQKINNNICRGSNDSTAFKWDAGDNPIPTSDDCTCGQNEIKLIRNKGKTPLCIPKTIDPQWYSDTTELPSP